MDDTPGTEAERVFRWRRQELTRVGYTTPQAELLAAEGRVDLHYALDLVTKHGWPADLAFDLLREEDAA